MQIMQSLKPQGCISSKISPSPPSEGGEDQGEEDICWLPLSRSSPHSFLVGRG